MTKTLTVLERLELVEKNTSRVQEGLDGLFTQFRGSLQSQMEIVEAVIETCKAADPEFINKVQAQIEAKRAERVAAREEQERKQLEAMVTAGVLKTSDVVTAESVVVGRVFDKDGAVAQARLQRELGSFSAEIQTALVNQGVGFVYEAPTTEKFEVLEVYEIVKEAPKAMEEAVAPADASAVGTAAPAETVSVES